MLGTRRHGWMRACRLLAAALWWGVMGGGCTGLASPEQNAAVTVKSGMLRLRSEDAPLQRAAVRGQAPQLEYVLRLEHVPLGHELALVCTWRSASRDVHYHNSWRTKLLSHDPWATHCRHTFGAHDPAGAWSVVMKLGERTLGTAHFSLE
jgi:hypothetical protein